MNQAFGGAFLIKIALIFLMIYIFVLGFAINYAKGFTMKNRLISLVEQYEGDLTSSAFLSQVNTEMNNLNYVGVESISDIPSKVGTCTNRNDRTKYCIVRHTAANNTEYYTITTYIQFNIPLVKDINSVGVIPVTGETRYIYDF